MRSGLSAAAKRALFSQETGAVFPILLSISHATLSEPIRVCANSVDLTYQGNVYKAANFRFDPPDEREDQIANARLTIGNIDRSILAVLRGLKTPPTIVADAAFYDDSSGVIFEPVARWDFLLRNVSYTSTTITGELVYEDRLVNRVPGLVMTPQAFPGAH